MVDLACGSTLAGNYTRRSTEPELAISLIGCVWILIVNVKAHADSFGTYVL